MNYYAHSAEGRTKEDWQKLKDHLTAVAALASEYAGKFNQMCVSPSRECGEVANATDDYTRRIMTGNPERYGAAELAYTAGLLHDIGKYSREFQEKLEGKNRLVDHSTAGVNNKKRSENI